MMSNSKGFAHELAHDNTLRERDILVAVAWYLTETKNSGEVPITEVFGWVAEHSVRLSINHSRARRDLKAERGVSLSQDGTIRLSLPKSSELRSRYQTFLVWQPPEIGNSILEANDFVSSRGYIINLVHQINGCHQFGFFDGCAVMMRRLMEVLIIDAYENTGARDRIEANGQYMQLSGLIGVLKSGQDFKLSRNAPNWIEECKLLGDNAAHSRTYVTKQIDIENFSSKYRNLIAELQTLK